MSLLKEQHSELQEHCNAKIKRARTLYERLDDCIQKLGTYLWLKIKNYLIILKDVNIGSVNEFLASDTSQAANANVSAPTLLYIK